MIWENYNQWVKERVGAGWDTKMGRSVLETGTFEPLEFT